MNSPFVTGFDEAGRGPCFGSLFLTAVRVRPQDRHKLFSLGLKDSKKLSSLKINFLAKQIFEKFQVFQIKIEAEEISQSNNLDNLIFAKINSLLPLIPNEGEFYFDQIGSPRTFKENIISLNPEKKISAYPKADSIFPEVMAAGIVSKYSRESELNALRTIFPDLPSGYPADPKTKSFLKQNISKLREINFIRENWKNIKELSFS